MSTPNLNPPPRCGSFFETERLVASSPMVTTNKYKNLDPSEIIQNGMNPKKTDATIFENLFNHFWPPPKLFFSNINLVRTFTDSPSVLSFLEPVRVSTIFLLGSSGPPFGTRNTCPLSCRSWSSRCPNIAKSEGVRARDWPNQWLAGKVGGWVGRWVGGCWTTGWWWLGGRLLVSSSQVFLGLSWVANDVGGGFSQVVCLFFAPISQSAIHQNPQDNQGGLVLSTGPHFSHFDLIGERPPMAIGHGPARSLGVNPSRNTSRWSFRTSGWEKLPPRANFWVTDGIRIQFSVD